MSKKCIIIFLVPFLIIVAVGASIFASGISRELVEKFLSGDTKAEEKIIEMVLSEAKIKKDAKDAGLSIRNEQVLTGENNTLFIISLGQKENIIAAYTKNKDGYTYLGLVDTFMELLDIQVMPVRGNKSNLVVVRERTNQLVGAMEDGIYIRAYIYSKGNFNQVLSVVEDYRAYNKLNGKWQRVAQKARIVWENEFYPVINILQSQNYAEAQEAPNKQMPSDDKFDIIKSREITDVYKWSDKWNHFIMGEGRNTINGKEAAIIMDWSESPFGMVSEFDKEMQRYLIKYKDGSMENINKELLRT